MNRKTISKSFRSYNEFVNANCVWSYYTFVFRKQILLFKHGQNENENVCMCLG